MTGRCPACYARMRRRTLARGPWRFEWSDTTGAAGWIPRSRAASLLRVARSRGERPAREPDGWRIGDLRLMRPGGAETRSGCP